MRWLDQGAPSRLSKEERPASSPGGRSRSKRVVPQDPGSRARPTEKRTRDRRLARVLARGLSHLPFDDQQRERALALARDALPPPRQRTSEKKTDDVAGLAAAVAYAIVYVDHVPLSQAEVAAPFRVAVGRLRGRFAELRAKLDIIPGDARYATTRR